MKEGTTTGITQSIAGYSQQNHFYQLNPSKKLQKLGFAEKTNFTDVNDFCNMTVS